MTPEPVAYLVAIERLRVQVTAALWRQRKALDEQLTSLFDRARDAIQGS